MNSLSASSIVCPEVVETKFTPIDIYNVCLDTIPHAVLNYDGWGITMAKCCFSEFPMFLTKKKCLRTLILGGNSIAEVPPEISNMTYLRSLNMIGNKLKDLPSSMQLLDSLSWLSFGANDFTHVPDVIYQIPNLKYVSLMDCDIPQKEIDSLRKVRPWLVVEFEPPDWIHGKD